MRVLVVGASGVLGEKVLAILSQIDNWEVFATQPEAI